MCDGLKVCHHSGNIPKQAAYARATTTPTFGRQANRREYCRFADERRTRTIDNSDTLQTQPKPSPTPCKQQTKPNATLNKQKPKPNPTPPLACRRGTPTLLYFSDTKPTVRHLLEYPQQVMLHVGPVAHTTPVFVADGASRHPEPDVVGLPGSPQ